MNNINEERNVAGAKWLHILTWFSIAVLPGSVSSMWIASGTDFKPVKYPDADISTLSYNNGKSMLIDAQHPTFLDFNSPKILFQPNPEATERIHKELKAHYQYMISHKHLNQILNVFPGKRLTIRRGKSLKSKFGNVKSFVYPSIAGARVDIFDNGDQKVIFPDGAEYTRYSDGVQFYTSPGKTREYQFLLDKSGKLSRFHCIIGGTKYAYLVPENGVTIKFGNRKLAIDNQYTKNLGNCDNETGRWTKMTGRHHRLGHSWSGIDGTSPRVELDIYWDRSYRRRAVGPFVFHYTDRDKSFVSKLKSDRLVKLKSLAVKTLGIEAPYPTHVILPDSLDTYMKIFRSGGKDSVVKSESPPAAFESGGIIVSWPPSVPQYTGKSGKKYFENVQFYGVLAHEFSHLLVHLGSGMSHIPNWLSEGAATKVTYKYMPEIGKLAYRDLNRKMSKGIGFNVSLESLTARDFGSYSDDKVLFPYLRSLELVDFLYGKFGVRKVVAFIRLFNVNTDPSRFLYPDPQGLVRHEYRTKLKSVFGGEIEEALARLLAPKKLSTGQPELF